MGGRAELASIWVQLNRLHGSLRLTEVVGAIDETVTNLVGSEDFGLFLRDDVSGRYEKLFATGDEVGKLGDLSDGDDIAREALATGTIDYGGPMAAVVPLKSALDGGFVGLLVVVRLLPHKPGVTAADRALFEVFGSHAGLALEAALCAAVGRPRVLVSELRARIDRPPHPIRPIGPIGPIGGDRE